MTSDDSPASMPRNAGRYLTRPHVTWREATDGSLFFVLIALAGAMVIAGRELRAHVSSPRSGHSSTYRRFWS